MPTALTAGIVSIGKGNLVLAILLGVAICYFMGLWGLGGLAYISLGVTLAPALEKLGGLNPIAIHLFILWYSLMSGITPPIAVTAWVAASLADADPMKTSITAARLAAILYFVPFFFLFKPTLILQGPSLIESLYLFFMCLLGVTFVASGLEGYVIGLGRLRLLEKGLLVAGGFLIALPEFITTAVGIVICTTTVAVSLIAKRRQRKSYFEASIRPSEPL